jgi:hypothetical protein
MRDKIFYEVHLFEHTYRLISCHTKTKIMIKNTIYFRDPLQGIELCLHISTPHTKYIFPINRSVIIPQLLDSL